MNWLNDIDRQAIFDIGIAQKHGDDLIKDLVNEPVKVIDFYSADLYGDIFKREECAALYSIYIKSGMYQCTRLYSRYTEKECQVFISDEYIWDITSDGKNANTYIWLWDEQAMLSWNVRAGVWYIKKVDGGTDDVGMA